MNIRLFCDLDEAIGLCNKLISLLDEDQSNVSRYINGDILIAYNSMCNDTRKSIIELREDICRLLDEKKEL